MVDDVTVYRLADDQLMLCVNAANVEKDYRWVVEHGGTAEIRDRSTETALIAIQGPDSTGCRGGHRRRRRSRAEPAPLPLRRHPFARPAGAALEHGLHRLGGLRDLLRGRGCGGALAGPLRGGALAPAGLGARDTLRLEAALPLYGHELDDTTSPLEAGLDRFVKREAGGFLGAEAIERRARAGHRRKLVGFVLEERGIARAEHVIESEGKLVGVVTSGGPSPTLGKSIGLGYVPPALGEPGDGLQRDRERAPDPGACRRNTVLPTE